MKGERGGEGQTHVLELLVLHLGHLDLVGPVLVGPVELGVRLLERALLLVKRGLLALELERRRRQPVAQVVALLRRRCSTEETRGRVSKGEPTDGVS